MTVHEPVAEIVLNGTEITVHAGALIGGDERVLEVDKVVPDAEAGRLTLELPGRGRDRRVHAAARVLGQAQRSDGGHVPLAVYG